MVSSSFSTGGVMSEERFDEIDRRFDRLTADEAVDLRSHSGVPPEVDTLRLEMRAGFEMILTRLDHRLASRQRRVSATVPFPR